VQRWRRDNSRATCCAGTHILNPGADAPHPWVVVGPAGSPSRPRRGAFSACIYHWPNYRASMPLGCPPALLIAHCTPLPLLSWQQYRARLPRGIAYQPLPLPPSHRRLKPHPLPPSHRRRKPHTLGEGVAAAAAGFRYGHRVMTLAVKALRGAEKRSQRQSVFTGIQRRPSTC